MPIKLKIKKNSRIRGQLLASIKKKSDYEFHLAQKQQTQYAKEQLEKHSLNYAYDDTDFHKVEIDQRWEQQSPFLPLNRLRRQTLPAQINEKYHLPKNTTIINDDIKSRYKSQEYKTTNKIHSRKFLRQQRAQRKQKNMTKVVVTEYQSDHQRSLVREIKTFTQFKPLEQKNKMETLNFIKTKKKKSGFIRKTFVRDRKFNLSEEKSKSLLYKQEPDKILKIKIEKNDSTIDRQSQLRERFQKFKKLINLKDYQKRGSQYPSPIKISKF